MKTNLLHKNIITIYIILITISSTFGQSVFEKSYSLSGEQLMGLFAGPSNGNGIIIAGTKTTTQNDPIVLKTDINGTSLWAKQYSGSGDDIFRTIRPTSDGGYIAVGYTNSFGAGDYDVLLAKLDASGTVSWAKTYGTADIDKGYDVIQTSDGGFAIAGVAKLSSIDGVPGAMYLIKTDNAGTVSWSKMWDGTATSINTVIQTTDGGYAVSGKTNTTFILAKTNNTGIVTWVKMYMGGMTVNYCAQTIQTSDGGYAMIGYGISSSKTVIGFAKIDASGTVQFLKTLKISNQYAAFAWGVRETWNRGYLITASDASSLYLISTDSTGAVTSSIITSSSISDGSSTNNNMLSLNAVSGGAFVTTAASDLYTHDKIFLFKGDGNGYSGCVGSPVTIQELDNTFNLYPTSLTSSGTTITNSATLTVSSLTLTTNTICTGTFIEENEDISSVLLFPNPSDGKFIISSEPKINSVEIFNVLSKRIYQSSDFNDQLPIDISKEPTGIYFVQIKSGENIYYHKLLKQ